MESKMSQIDKFKEISYSLKSQIIEKSWIKLTDQQRQKFVNLASGKLLKIKNDAKPDFKTEENEVQKKQKGKRRDFRNCVNKPKNVRVAFIFFSVSVRPMLVQDNPNLKLPELARLTGKEWIKLDDFQKKVFYDMEKEDVLRFDKENKQFKELGYFINYEGVNSSLLNRRGEPIKSEIGPVMPKHVVNAYMYFMKENLDKARKAAPDGKFQGRKIGKESGQKWKLMSPNDKEKYTKLYLEDQLRYNNQLEQIKKEGFFMTKDGIKSIDLPQKQKKSLMIKNQN